MTENHSALEGEREERRQPTLENTEEKTQTNELSMCLYIETANHLKCSMKRLHLPKY